MNEPSVIGKSYTRKDGAEKVHGRIRYTDDLQLAGTLHAALLTSPHAHAEIVSIDTSPAASAPGVRGVATGDDFPYLLGIYLGDKPPLARGRVRQFGEPVAAVIADTPEQAEAALSLIRVEYRPLPAVLSVREALAPGAPLIHEEMDKYARIPAILPEPGSNVANRTRILKGDPEGAMAAAAVTVEQEFSFPPGDHVAMEPRAARAEIRPNGTVVIRSSTQAPFVVRALMSRFFDLPPGKIEIVAPPVGGGFGGKAGIQLEGLAYLLSRKVGGRPVRLVNSREQDIVSSPGHIGMEAKVKIGADRDGRLTAMDLLYLFDSGSSADYAVNVSRAGAIACTGPYRVDNVRAESLCVYTNHPFATAYRGFGHEVIFAIERALDRLADQLEIDPVELRIINAIRPGDTSPTRSRMDPNTGDLPGCLGQAAEMIGWEKGSREEIGPGRVRGRGISSFWKAPAMPPNADAGVILTFNEDGSINLNSGILEIGNGTYTGLAQIVAERFRDDPDRVHVNFEVRTVHSPHDWATAASRSLFMAGRAALAAADDAIARIKKIAAAPLRCPEEDLDVAGGRVFLRDDPERGLDLAEVVLGYQYPDGQSIGGQVIGRGSYISRGLTGLDPETGEGHPALEWTLGAEAVEVEVDLNDGTFEVIRAVCAMDVGRVINPRLARGNVVGAMEMALGFSTTEGFVFDDRGRPLNYLLRDFKIPRYGEHPRYGVEFLNTPQKDGPYGARGLGEQGILGIPGALANAVSRAIGRPIDSLPITPEKIWQAIRGGGQ
ncbi:MAG: xanthine dehydrogenase family protein molybdopterin-binding subunit [Candidatus Erginobacter occultus]|nr:xanthine dehydrogenase family protein molybdopterin-binding subunit [Candidatus Erginobacter occultus]